MNEAKGKFSADLAAYVVDRVEAYLGDLMEEVGIVDCTDRAYYEYVVAIREEMLAKCNADLEEAHKFFDKVA